MVVVHIFLLNWWNNRCACVQTGRMNRKLLGETTEFCSCRLWWYLYWTAGTTSIGGEKSWKNFVGNISEGVVKPEFLCLFIPWGVKWRGLLSGISSGFVFPDLVFLFCSNVCFPSIFGLDGVEAGFAPEKVFDVICWCLVKCDDSAKIVWKKSEKYLDN